jgi:hypothetical protein
VKALREPGVAPASAVSSDGRAFACLLGLAAVDLALMAAHVAYRHDEPLYQLGRDGGYPEMFQYAKTYAIVCLLGAVWWRTREHVFGAWMLVFAYVLADDALRVHERAGAAIAASWDYAPAFGLRAQDFGELTVWAAFGLAFLVALVLSYLRASREARRAARVLGEIFCLLAFFGAFVDMLHSAAQPPRLRAVLGMLEDGGEMLAMSLACWYALKLFERSTRP